MNIFEKVSSGEVGGMALFCLCPYFWFRQEVWREEYGWVIPAVGGITWLLLIAGAGFISYRFLI